MNDFIHSCNAAATYPKNLISPREYQHTLQSYVDHLDAREKDEDLFGDENQAALEFWDLDDGATDFKFTRTKSQEVENHIHFPPLAARLDPRCRYVFVHAPSGRANLSVTRKMLLTTTSYHQIMPSFVDFLFSFGAQHHAKDFFFAGFRHDTRLSDREKSVAIPTLGRSGRSLRLCYSLRSVEASSGQEKWPWSIRGTAVHQEFDFETGRSNWLIVKGEGGASMKDRIIAETSSKNGNMLNKFDSRDQRFSSTMSTHLLLCNWSVENWRWYINYMEQEVQTITRKTLSVRVAASQTGPKPKMLFTRTATGILVPPKKSPTSKSFAAKKQPTTPPPKVAPALPTQGPPGPPGPPPRLSTLPRTTTIDPFQPDSEFSFKDLQRIEYIEEHANQALLVITLNSSILSALVQHYTSVMESTSCPSDLKIKCKMDFRRFVDRISDISAEIQTQRARVETLLRLLADRKALFYGILEYRNVEASKELAGKAQISADHVEYMTQQMKQEAVFMRIITLVTLFFLPGTFVSTLLSTDIVHWQTPAPGGLEKVVSKGAIKMFLYVTIPFMFLTFSAAIGFYSWSKRHERKAMERQAAELTQPQP